ncbi:MAG: hypothetical protein ACFCVH_05270 [Alphaproteobacteria bacterium]
MLSLRLLPSTASTGMRRRPVRNGKLHRAGHGIHEAVDPRRLCKDPLKVCCESRAAAQAVMERCWRPLVATAGGRPKENRGAVCTGLRHPRMSQQFAAHFHYLREAFGSNYIQEFQPSHKIHQNQ